MVPREALALSTGQELGIVGEQAAFQEGLQGQFYSGARPVPSAGTPGPVHLPEPQLRHWFLHLLSRWSPSTVLAPEGQQGERSTANLQTNMSSLTICSRGTPLPSQTCSISPGNSFLSLLNTQSI